MIVFEKNSSYFQLHSSVFIYLWFVTYLQENMATNTSVQLPEITTYLKLAGRSLVVRLKA